MHQKGQLNKFKSYQAKNVLQTIKKKAIIKQKIALLKKVKSKNEAAFI